MNIPFSWNRGWLGATIPAKHWGPNSGSAILQDLTLAVLPLRHHKRPVAHSTRRFCQKVSMFPPIFWGSKHPRCASQLPTSPWQTDVKSCQRIRIWLQILNINDLDLKIIATQPWRLTFTATEYVAKNMSSNFGQTRPIHGASTLSRRLTGPSS